MNQNVRFANPLKVISSEAGKAKEAMSVVGEKMSTVGQAIASGNAEIEQSADAASKGLNDVVENGEKAKGSLEGVSNAESQASKETSKFRTALASVKSAFKGMKMPFAEFLSSIKRIAMYRLLRSIIKQITQGFMEAYHAMYRWSQAGNDNNQFAESMDKIATALHYIHASLSALASPIINALAPAIDWLADRFVGLLNIINQVLATINNQSGWTRAIKKQITYGDTLNDTNKKAKELKKTLLGIDEINLLNGANGSGTTDTDSLYDYEWVEFGKDNAIHNLFEDWDLGNVLRQLGAILLIVEGLKTLMSGNWLVGGGLLGSAAALEFWDAFDDIFTKQMDIWTGAKLLAGTALAIAAGASLGKAFGNTIMGAAIGGIIGGVTMTVAGIVDIVKNGLNWLNALATVAGGVITGISVAVLTGTSVIMGGVYGLVVGTIALIVATVIDKWTYLVDTWKNWITGFSQLSMSFGNFVISIIEMIANAMIKDLINPFLSFINALYHTNLSIPEVSLPKYNVGTVEEIWNTYLNPATTGKMYSVYDKIGKDVDWGQVAPQLRSVFASDGTVDLDNLLGQLQIIADNQTNENKGQGDVYLDGDKVGKVMSKKSNIERKSLDLYNQVGVMTY